MNVVRRPGPETRERGRRVTAASLVEVLLVAALLAKPAFCAEEDRPAAAAPDEKAGRLSVAVLDFDNEEGDAELGYLSRGLRWLLATSLAEVRAIRVLSADAVDAALGKSSLASDDAVDAAQARRIGEWLEARRVIYGGFRPRGDAWQWAARIVNVGTGQELASELAVEGTDLVDLRDELVQKILQVFEVGMTTEERAAVTYRPATSREALDLLLRAPLQKERASEAKSLLQRALAIDPSSVTAKVRLAWVLAMEGDLARASILVEQALAARRQSLSGLVLLGSLLMARQDFDAAERVFEEARALRPGNVGVLARLGELYLKRQRLDLAADVMERVVRLSPVLASAHAHLARVYFFQRKAEPALAELAEARRLDPENREVVLISAQLYERLNDTPRALEHYEHFRDLLREAGDPEGQLPAVEGVVDRLRRSLTPQFNRAERPRTYTSAQLEEELRRRLTKDELAVVVNPLEANDALREWARELTAGRTTDRDRARAIFDGLTRRIQTRSGGTARTALEVFAAWKRPEEVFNCQEYAKLYIALARVVGVDAFYVHLEQDYRGKVVYHDCAAVFIEGRALLVDPAYRWFGVRHTSFTILDDLQTIAHQLFQGFGRGDRVVRCRVAEKLHPDFAWGKVALARALIDAGENDAARTVIEEAERLEGNRWDVYFARGTLAAGEGHPEEAEGHYRKALALHPEGARLHAHLGHVFAEQGRLIEAREAFRTAQRLGDPELAEEARRIVAELNEKLAELSSPLVGGVLAARERLRRAEELGAYGDLASVEFVGGGVEARAIRCALLQSPAFLTGFHPRAPLDEALEFLRGRIQRGFLWSGFPHARVEVALDHEGRRIVVRMREGERFQAGEIRIEGNEIIPEDEIVKVLSQPPANASGKGTRGGKNVSRALWNPGSPARFGPDFIQRAAAVVKEVYGKRGYQDAEIHVSIEERAGRTALLVVRIVREGPRFRLGEFSFVGPHTDAPEDLAKRLGLREGMIADSELATRVAEELESLGRYYEVRARDLPGARAGEIDLEVYLQQAEFTPPLSEPPSEATTTLRNALQWLDDPGKWGIGHVVTVGPGSDASTQEGSLTDKLTFEFALAREGFAFSLDRNDGRASPVPLARFAVVGAQRWMSVPPLGLASRFQGGRGIDFVLRTGLSLRPPGPEHRWQLVVGVGVVHVQKASGFRWQLAFSPVTLAGLIDMKLELSPREDRLAVVYDHEGERIPIGSIDRKTGEVRFEIDIERPARRVSLSSSPDVLAEPLGEAREPVNGVHYDSLEFPVLVARLAPHLVAYAAPELFGKESAFTFSARLLLDRFFRDDGFAVRGLRRLWSHEFWEKADGDFTIALSREETAPWRENQFGLLAHMAAVLLTPQFPTDSWPRTLLLEVACAVTHQSRYTQKELLRILNSPEVGPIGHWAFAEILRFGGMGDLARKFGERSFALCSTEGFGREILLLEESMPGVLADLGLGLKTATDEEVAALFGEAEPATEQLRELRELSVRRGAADPRALGEALLAFVWRDRLETLLLSRLAESWPDLAPVPALPAGVADQVERSDDPRRLRQHFIDEAKRFVGEGKLEDAVQHYRWALELDFHDHRSHEDLGALLIRLEEYDDAVVALSAALGLSKTCQRTRGFLRQALLVFIRDPVRKNIERAVFYARHLISLTKEDDPDFGALLALAEAQGDIDGARWEEAFARLERARRVLGPHPLIDDEMAVVERAVLPDRLTYASIDAALEEPVVLVSEGAEWRFFRGRAEPSNGLEWTGPEFDDRGWEIARGGFGYGESGHGTVLDDMRGAYTTFYCRRAFSLPEAVRAVRLRVRADDGFVVYVNGEEVGRVNAGESGQRLGFDAVATELASEPLVEHTLEVPLDLLRAGRNILALQGLNRSLAGSSDFSLTATLECTGQPDPERDRARFEEFRKAARGKTAARRIAYFEARVLQRAGHYREAATALRELRQEDPDSPEPRDRLVECLHQLGEDEEADRLLEGKKAR